MQADEIYRGNYSGGALQRYKQFPSRLVAERTVDIWLPPGYDATAGTAYPVFYMHDGQNLFEPSLAYTGIDWGMDEAVVRLMRAGVCSGAIVVGAWNTATRRRDYMPARPLVARSAKPFAARFARENDGPPLSDQYLRFVVDELKPFVDAHFRTQPDRGHTFVMGSSMGGLISLYAMIEYPQIFGGAGCLSTHWPVGGVPMIDAMAAALPSSATHRIYFDYGTATLDALYEPYQQLMDIHMETTGYQWGKSWVTHKFDGAEHTEAAWRARVDVPLRFLLTGLGG